MGRLAAEDMAALNLNRRSALIWHLQSNHFPPVPHVWLDVAERVIDRLNAGGDREEKIPHPVFRSAEGVPETVTLGEVARHLHLDPWLDTEEDI